MKSKYIFSSFFAIGLIAVSSTIIAFSSVPPSGRTGSPSDQSNCSGCHGGNPVLNLQDVIQTDIPESGYVPGETYSINISSGAERAGAQRYGFQLSPQDSEGALVGTLTSESGQTVSNDGKYISHNGAQATVSPSWTFSWTAPEAGAGNFTFYLSVVAANFNGGTSGDEVILSELSISEAVSNTTSSLVFDSPNIFVSNELLNIEHSRLEQLIVYDINGKMVYSSSAPSNKTDISLLKEGIYIVNIKANGKWFKEKFIK